MSVFAPRSQSEATVLFDIGSASVGAAVAVLHPEGQPEMVYAVREPIVFRDELSASRLRDDLLTVLARVGERVVREGLSRAGSPPARIRCILGSPWFRAESFTVQRQAKRPVRITHEHLQGLIAEEMARRTAPQNGTNLERVVVDIQTDGKTQDEPIGVRVRDLAVSVFVSTASDTLIAGMQEVLVRLFHERPVTFHSSALAMASALRGFSATEAYTIIDVDGEVTDVSIVRGGVLRSLATFPIGTRTILRQLADSTALSTQQVHDALGRLTLGESAAHEEAALEDALNRVCDTWLFDLRGVLDATEEDEEATDTAFVIAPDAFALPLVLWVKEQGLIQERKRLGVPSVFPLTGASFARLLSGDGDARHDVFLNAAARFASILFAHTKESLVY